MRARLLAGALLASALSGAASAAPLTVRSPDGQVEVTVDLAAGGQPVYAVRFHGREVISPSNLGLAFEQYKKLGPGMAVAGSRATAGTDSYTLPAAKVSKVADRYNQLAVTFRETAAPARELQVVFRAYDSGAAFRYHLPAQASVPAVRLAGELTQFAMPADYDCWGFNIGKFQSSHEGEYDPFKLSHVRGHNLYETPVTCRTGAGDATLAITQAALTDWAGFYLTSRETGDLGFELKLSPRLDDPTVAVKLPVGGDGIDSPWRVVMLGDTPGKLIESTIITSLNPPAAGDFSWVKPGKTAWDWWNGPTLKALGSAAGTNDATEKAYIDFAAANGLQYMLIDEGWYVNSGGGGTVYPGADAHTTVPGIHLPELVKYAADRNVGIWLWFNWQVLDRDMDGLLAKYAAIGIKGVKVDFMDRDDQEIVAWYQKIAALTAKHHLMLDLHGAYRPTGMIRTWPNFITQEGVMGAEYNKWTRRVTATHNVTLPFTRGLAGPYDYTPGGFRNATPASFRIQPQTPMVQTTRGQALAMYVVFDSPFTGVSDSPDNYAGASGMDFIRAVPAAWDETRVLSGTIGEQIAIARRRGSEWYVGAMTNEAPRHLMLPLGFLGSGRFQATIWQDGRDPTTVDMTSRTVAAGDAIDVALAPSGGAAIRLVPAR